MEARMKLIIEVEPAHIPTLVRWPNVQSILEEAKNILLEYVDTLDDAEKIMIIGNCAKKLEKLAPALDHVHKAILG
jgi:hypothetical protein